jgi:hypothetical protein
LYSFSPFLQERRSPAPSAINNASKRSIVSRFYTGSIEEKMFTPCLQGRAHRRLNSLWLCARRPSGITSARIEAIYTVDRSQTDWLKAVLESSREWLDGGMGLFGFTWTIAHDGCVRFEQFVDPDKPTGRAGDDRRRGSAAHRAPHRPVASQDSLRAGPVTS